MAQATEPCLMRRVRNCMPTLRNSQFAQLLGLVVAESAPWVDSEPNFDPGSGCRPKA